MTAAQEGHYMAVIYTIYSMFGASHYVTGISNIRHQRVKWPWSLYCNSTSKCITATVLTALHKIVLKKTHSVSIRTNSREFDFLLASFVYLVTYKFLFLIQKKIA